MNQAEVITKTVTYVKQKMTGDSTGHDWWHVYRVWKNAQRIAETESVNLFIVELGALLHDIADWKFYDEAEGPKVAREWLESLKIDPDVTDQVCEIVNTVSFKGGHQVEMKTLEGRVVRDADRLDALGAIGIARAFAYGGNKNREMHNPTLKPALKQTKEQYKRGVNSTTINHFYEKLLLLKGLMATATGQKLAAARHNYVKQFLDEFLEEWEGER